MFRDLKEYQDITKLYVDKVSKTENLEERRGSSIEQQAQAREAGAQKLKNLGNRIMTGNKEGIKKTSTNTGGRVKGEVKLNPGKPTPASQIRKIDPAPFNKREKVAPVDKETPSPSSSSSSTPAVSDKTKQGKPRTKAQMMAAKRIASGKTIADVKKSNTDAMKAKAKERFEKFKADREAKRLERMKEEYTPYEIVLEYLLSTEQVATIEEANYVMTEMDAETIQSIVEMDMMKMPVVNVLGGIAGAVGGTVAAAKYLGRKAGERSIKKTKPSMGSEPADKPSEPQKSPGLIKKIKNRTDATNKAIEQM